MSYKQYEPQWNWIKIQKDSQDLARVQRRKNGLILETYSDEIKTILVATRFWIMKGSVFLIHTYYILELFLNKIYVPTCSILWLKVTYFWYIRCRLKLLTRNNLASPKLDTSETCIQFSCRAVLGFFLSKLISYMIWDFSYFPKSTIHTLRIFLFLATKKQKGWRRWWW